MKHVEILENAITVTFYLLILVAFGIVVYVVYLKASDKEDVSSRVLYTAPKEVKADGDKIELPNDTAELPTQAAISAAAVPDKAPFDQDLENYVYLDKDQEQSEIVDFPLQSAQQNWPSLYAETELINW